MRSWPEYCNLLKCSHFVLQADQTAEFLNMKPQQASCLLRELQLDLFGGEGIWLGVSRRRHRLRLCSRRRYRPDRPELPGAGAAVRAGGGCKRCERAADIWGRRSGDSAEAAWVLLHPVRVLFWFSSMWTGHNVKPCWASLPRVSALSQALVHSLQPGQVDNVVLFAERTCPRTCTWCLKWTAITLFPSGPWPAWRTSKRSRQTWTWSWRCCEVSVLPLLCSPVIYITYSVLMLVSRGGFEAQM